MSTIAQVDRSRLDGVLEQPVDGTQEKTSPVDASRRRELYTGALDLATGKGEHGAKPGTIELGERWAWRHEPDECRGRLRAAYVRVTTSIPYPRPGWRAAGKTAWVQAGVVCDACDAFWPKPRA